MLCAKCHQNEAAFHFTMVVDGAEEETVHLCKDCAPCMGLPTLDPKELEALSVMGKVLIFFLLSLLLAACQRHAEPGRYEQARKPAACREAKQGISFDASGRFAIAHRSLLRGRSWYYVTSARAGCRQRETFGLCCTPALSPLHSLIRPVKRLCPPLAIHDVIDACRRNTERLRQRAP